jgi:hypothetical protein
VPGLIASIALQIITARLDPSVGRSGPHDLAVRENAFVGAASALSLLVATSSRRLTSVTIAIRPSAEAGWAETNHVFLKNGREIFLSARLDMISDWAK